MRGRPDVYSGGSDDGEPARPPRSRLVIAAGVAVAVLLGALVVALLQDDESDDSSTPAPTAGATTSGASAPMTRGSMPTTSPVPSGPTAPPDSVAGVVGRFAKAWMQRTSAEERRRALAPVATASLVDGLVLTDVSLLPPPGTRLAGEATLQSGTPSQGIYLQRFSDGESIVVTAGNFGSGRWLVVDVQPGPESAAG